jgi:hypothetical protein
MKRAIAVSVVVAVLAVGCGETFDPFNEITDLRVLAVRAEPPALAPGQAAALDALVYQPDAGPISYAWSWCPMTLGSATGYECAVSEEELRAAFEQVAPGAGALVPSYDLGAAPTAEFSYAIPAGALAALCEAIASQSAPAFVALPQCADGLTLTIRLDVTAAGKTVTAVKQLPLLVEAADDANANPTIGAVYAAPAADRVDPLTDGLALDPDAPAALSTSTKYDLAVDVPEDASQLFVPAATADEPNPTADRETLFLSWFVTGGATDQMRTGFIDGDASMDGLEQNTWTTPDLASSGGAAELILVLQDERGGVAWARRSIALAGE